MVDEMSSMMSGGGMQITTQQRYTKRTRSVYGQVAIQPQASRTVYLQLQGQVPIYS